MTWLAHRPRALGRLRRSRLAALVGIATIVLQSALTVAHALPLSTADVGRAADATAFWGTTARVLCALDARRGAPDAPAGSHHHALPTCPLCQAVQHLGAWMPPAGGWAPADPRGALVVPTPATPPLSMRIAVAGIQARAPPVRA